MPAQGKRELVRWNTDIDNFLMLAIQSVCNNQGIKIPWNLVADTMGPPITEGAVVQHLAKTRQRLEEAGKPVPPPLRRGGPAPIIKPGEGQGAAVLMGGTGRSRKRTAASLNDDKEYGYAGGRKANEDDNGYNGGTSKKKAPLSRSKKALKLEDSDDYDGTQIKKQRPKSKRVRYNDDDDDDEYKDPAAIRSVKASIVRPRKQSIDYARLNGGDSDSDDGESSGQTSVDSLPAQKVRSKVQNAAGETVPAMTKVKDETSPNLERHSTADSDRVVYGASRGEEFRAHNGSGDTNMRSFGLSSPPQPLSNVRYYPSRSFASVSENAPSLTPTAVGTPFASDQPRSFPNLRIDSGFHGYPSNPLVGGIPYGSYTSLNPTPASTSQGHMEASPYPQSTYNMFSTAAPIDSPISPQSSFAINYPVTGDDVGNGGLPHGSNVGEPNFDAFAGFTYEGLSGINEDPANQELFPNFQSTFGDDNVEDEEYDEEDQD